jgi:hypothetical protein
MKMCRLILFSFLIFVFTRCSDNASRPVTSKDEAVKAVTTNSPMDGVIKSYSDLTEAFVNWDSISVKNYAEVLRKSLDSAEAENKTGNDEKETVKDIFGQVKNATLRIEQFKNITRQRQEFDSLSRKIYQLLKSSSQNSPQVFLHVCPMAFNDIDSGYWLSKSNSIRNPYMGLHHPRYHSGMLNCGETLDSIKQLR